MAIERDQLRRTLGSFATGVTIVTCRLDDGTRGGMTANSFASVSLDPPLVLWSIDKASDQFDVFARATGFAINILSEGQIALSSQFAADGLDKFGSLQVDDGANGDPIITDSAAVIECTLHQRIECGDHVIMIGHVEHLQHSDRPPLLFHAGRYTKLAPQS